MKKLSIAIDELEGSFMGKILKSFASGKFVEPKVEDYGDSITLKEIDAMSNWEKACFTIISENQDLLSGIGGILVSDESRSLIESENRFIGVLILDSAINRLRNEIELSDYVSIVFDKSLRVLGLHSMDIPDKKKEVKKQTVTVREGDFRVYTPGTMINQ
ncbi:hypothetical protein ACFL08_05655 [Patescibacteria group bacterium]